MKLKSILLFSIYCFMQTAQAQQVMTPELLWKVKRLSPVGISIDQKEIIYKVSEFQVEQGQRSTKNYSISIQGGTPKEIASIEGLVKDHTISPNGIYQITAEKVKINKVLGTDYYPQYKDSDVKIYDDLHYRHWDTWMDGTYNHPILKWVNNPEMDGVDLLEGQPFHSPQMPFGGNEDFTWSPDGKKVLYVAKKKVGKEYALSTNTDIYQYDLKSRQTINLTEGMMGYDTHPEFSPKGVLTFLSMARDGYEADKNDIIIVENNKKINLTKDWDGTVNSFKWSNDASKIYFNAPIGGTIQLFEIDYKTKKIKQITDGDFDVNGLIGQVKNEMFVTRTDFNHAAEIYAIDLKSGKMRQITNVNAEIYDNLNLSKSEKRIVQTTDNKDMVVWVVYPPNFDPTKKYPTLLYCQGGPQSALTQFYSFRWNLQLMAAQGYIVVAPNRRGMPGHGVKWNEDISKDWGGQVMQDYLAAIDALAKESFVDETRLGAVGASYGGYSVFYLAGIHNKRFKTFISHNGVFDLKSMYGTTEELWFTNWDAGGAYWEKDNTAAQKTYSEFDPSNLVNNWDTPILIFQGGKDFRVPIGQGQEAFQAAQLKGIKSRFIYFPDENHWVLQPQNSVIWHKEFFRWLKETL